MQDEEEPWFNRVEGVGPIPAPPIGRAVSVIPPPTEGVVDRVRTVVNMVVAPAWIPTIVVHGWMMVVENPGKISVTVVVMIELEIEEIDTGAEG